MTRAQILCLWFKGKPPRFDLPDLPEPQPTKQRFHSLKAAAAALGGLPPLKSDK